MAAILAVSSVAQEHSQEADVKIRGQVTAWTGFIRVDGTAYTWMGNPSGPGSVTQTGFEYTSTKSIFTMNVGGKVEMNITFLSPLTPDDQKRQSLVFSYLDVVVQSLDGAAHDVQLYTDISAGKSQVTQHDAMSCDLETSTDALQNGSREIIVQLHSGIMVRPTIMLLTIKYIDKPNSSSVRQTSKLIGDTGTGRPKIIVISLTSPVSTLMSAELS